MNNISGVITLTVSSQLGWALGNAPETPIQNPGGVLRAMTARHRAGVLNLTGSIIGITERDKA